ncbi:MAG: hypothetical protein IJE51_03495 [Clostridia bacterium]|nr:hypothetical protein [Clostridia bacterium]
MKEKVLTNKKHGMAVLLLVILLGVLSVIGVVFGGIILDGGGNPTLFVISLIVLCLFWLPIPGLKVLKPQEALVLTLFGKYVGTIKDAGFYFVNPFCTAVNPAAKTKLNQSSDVQQVSLLNVNGANASVEIVDKKLSLKIMTLNRQLC